MLKIQIFPKNSYEYKIKALKEDSTIISCDEHCHLSSSKNRALSTEKGSTNAVANERLSFVTPKTNLSIATTRRNSPFPMELTLNHLGNP
jgi:hypothetical protein